LTIEPKRNPSATQAGAHEASLVLHTMAGRSHIDLAARCLSSIVKYYDRPIHVVVHDDGTTRPEDVERFQAKVPSSAFIFKRDADPVVNDFLARYPACRRLRDNLVYGLKIFDIQILEEGPELSYTDCDILFLRPVSRFFRLPDDPRAGGVFMKDPRQAYCLTPWQLMRNKRLHLADRLNGGLLHFRREAFDWDLVEWFLRHDQYVIHPYWKEQTAWSALGAATGSFFWDEHLVRVIRRRDELTPNIAVAHYVSSYRQFMEYVPARDREGEQPVAVTMFPFKECTGARFVADHARRIVRGATRRVNSFAERRQRNRPAEPSFPG